MVLSPGVKPSCIYSDWVARLGRKIFFSCEFPVTPKTQQTLNKININDSSLLYFSPTKTPNKSPSFFLSPADEKNRLADAFGVSCPKRETAIGYKKAKTNRNWVQILHFYHAKTVNIDMRRIHVPNTNLGRHERN